MMSSTSDMSAVYQGNVEALMQSSQIWTAGCQSLTKTMAETVQTYSEQSMANWKALSGVKSMKEAMDLSSSFMRASIEKAMADAGKLTEASKRLTEEAMAPLKARMTLASEKMVPATI
jgi:phasin family protein